MILKLLYYSAYLINRRIILYKGYTWFPVSRKLIIENCDIGGCRIALLSIRISFHKDNI
jgi:hypothetical protein